MWMRFSSRAIALVFVIAMTSLFILAAEHPNANPRGNRPKDQASLSEDVLVSIRLRLRELGAPEATQKDNLVRVTRAPFHVIDPAAAGCRPQTALPSNPHGGHWIDVYVTRAGRAPLVSGKGIYPEGSVILKQKLIDADGTKTDLFTGVLKREKGYNLQVGDWEFFVLDGKASAITASGKLRSCSACHEAYAATDYVSRSYLTRKLAKSD